MVGLDRSYDVSMCR